MFCQYVLTQMPSSFFGIWLGLFMAGLFSIFTLSTLAFRKLYSQPTFASWQYKSSGKYPSVGYVRKEMYQTLKGVIFATILPALSIYLRNEPYMQGYCPADIADKPEEEQYFLSYSRLLFEFCVVVLATDFFEFVYHWSGHYFDHGWDVHRHHHVYSNPTPWAVIADEPWDNMMRASPMLVLPFFLKLNIDTIFLTFAGFFYLYGTYLHCGFEADWIVPSDHWLVNTSFQHYVHHAKGTRSKPCHCGFFIRTWDQLWTRAGYPCEYDGAECFARTQRAAGKRSWKIWEEEILPHYPNYALLMNPRFMWHGEKHADFAGRLTVDLRDSVSTAASEDSPKNEGEQGSMSKATSAASLSKSQSVGSEMSASEVGDRGSAVVSEEVAAGKKVT
mmetsp:Transcript_9198/g.22556  ORF Transcript_9198/g.22556 Transcript_9198/m.22556 type:complete len:389 (-) Transcript_9198:1129-2295(-)|eukprot:CAMPEP_0179002512 /NCGR_PEP_ID=MMETSP0795-20121207/12070_1 /TAXON_ID=88552 /ORGANISM="Amoebophrya sp., Strain Ameob2" /LENGTH=388 /DNA_ID=CAMNT_0020696231 /DNA_START=255 /DNA_END=1421 /DNA_ORIENTATION=-